MHEPHNNKEMITAILDQDVPLLTKAIRSDQALKHKSGLLRISPDTQISAIINFVNALDDRDIPRELAAAVVEKSDASPEALNELISTSADITTAEITDQLNTIAKET